MLGADDGQERTVRDDQERRAAVFHLDGLLAEEQRIIASSSLEREVPDGLPICRPWLGIREVRVGHEVAGARLDDSSTLDALLALDALRQVEARAGAALRVLRMDENPIADDMNRVEGGCRQVHPGSMEFR